MLHPLLSQKKAFLIFLSSWILLFLVHFLFFLENESFSAAVAFADALIHNSILMILTLALYFPLAFSDNFSPDNKIQKKLLYHIFHHAVTAIVMLIIWLSAAFAISRIIFEQNPAYLEFIKTSLPVRGAIGGLILVLFITLYHFLEFYKHLENKTIREEQLKKMVKEAELKALKAQLNPHFLFNSLNSISSLTITNPESAREMTAQLSDFLRYSLRNKDEALLPLRDEIKNIHRYLEIEKVRFGDRLVCRFDIPDECYDLYMPSMLLQPVYENAIKHGLYESVEPVNIYTQCFHRNNSLEISVINNYDPESTSKKGEGVGLENIRSKLLLFYNRNDLLWITNENNEFKVKFFLPQKIKR